MSGLGTIAYIISSIIAGFRPALFKYYKKYMLFTIIISLISMWVGSALYLYYEGGIDCIKEGIIESVQWKNMKLSLLSETKFMSQAFSLIFLPISVLVPMKQLKFVSASYFDHLINGASYDITMVISIILLIVSGITIGLSDYQSSSKSYGYMSYMAGMMLILVSVVLSGYLLISFQNIVIKEGAGKTMMIESTGALLLMLPLLLVVEWPSWRLVILLLIGTTFVFNIGILLKFIGLRKISTYEAIVLGVITTIVGTILGPILFDETMTLMKIVGLLTIIGVVVYNGMFIEKKK